MDRNTELNYSKYKLAMSALKVDEEIYVHLMPKNQDVRVPLVWKQKDIMTLQFGTNMAVPIDDLNVDMTGISGTLSFNRVPFHCVVPWEAVYAITLVNDPDSGMIWEESIPEELKSSVFKSKEKQEKKVEQPKPKKKELPPYLKVIK